MIALQMILLHTDNYNLNPLPKNCQQWEIMHSLVTLVLLVSIHSETSILSHHMICNVSDQFMFSKTKCPALII